MSEESANDEQGLDEQALDWKFSELALNYFTRSILISRRVSIFDNRSYAFCGECKRVAYEGDTLVHRDDCLVGLARKLRGLPEVEVPEGGWSNA